MARGPAERTEGNIPEPRPDDEGIIEPNADDNEGVSILPGSDSDEGDNPREPGSDKCIH